jgi:hypothetical protein
MIEIAANLTVVPAETMIEFIAEAKEKSYTLKVR